MQRELLKEPYAVPVDVPERALRPVSFHPDDDEPLSILFPTGLRLLPREHRDSSVEVPPPDEVVTEESGQCPESSDSHGSDYCSAVWQIEETGKLDFLEIFSGHESGTAD